MDLKDIADGYVISFFFCFSRAAILATCGGRFRREACPSILDYVGNELSSICYWILCY